MSPLPRKPRPDGAHAAPKGRNGTAADTPEEPAMPPLDPDDLYLRDVCDDLWEMHLRADVRAKSAAEGLSPLQEEIDKRVAACDRHRQAAADLQRQAAQANQAADTEFAAAKQAETERDTLLAVVNRHKTTAGRHAAELAKEMARGGSAMVHPAERRAQAQAQAQQAGPQTVLDGPNTTRLGPPVTQPFRPFQGDGEGESTQVTAAFQGGTP